MSGFEKIGTNPIVEILNDHLREKTIEELQEIINNPQEVIKTEIALANEEERSTIYSSDMASLLVTCAQEALKQKTG